MLVEWVLAGEFGPFAQAAGLRIASDMKAVGCHGLTDVNVATGELAMDESDMWSNEEDEDEEEQEAEEQEAEEQEAEEQEADATSTVGDDHDEEQAAAPQEADEGNETATAPILAGYAQSLPHVLPNVSGLNWEEDPMDSESDDDYSTAFNNVWNLTCSECQAVVSQRGAKVHLVSDGVTEMFSTDLFCSGLTFHPPGGTRDHDACQCRIRDTCAFLYPLSCISGLHLRRFRS